MGRQFSIDYQIEIADQENFMAYALEAASKLNWVITSYKQNGFLADTNASWVESSQLFRIEVKGTIAHIKSQSTGTQLFDFGRNKENVTLFLGEIEEVKKVMTKEEVEAKLTEFRKEFVLDDTAISENSNLGNDEKAQSFLTVFKPVKGYFITPCLVNINILVFLLMVFSGVNIFKTNVADLLLWGSNFRPMTLDGGWWRLFTSCFIHIGIIHLVLNIYALIYIGNILESLLGKTRFLAAYLLAGIASSVASLWWQNFTVSAGASGAIFGMYGVFLALITAKFIDSSSRKSLLGSIAIFVGYNLLYGLRPESGVDNAAHIGGLISGLLIGYVYIPSLKNNENRNLKYAITGGLAALVMIGSFLVLLKLPNDFKVYENEMFRFANLEREALKVYQLPKESPKASFLVELNKGIDNWKVCIDLFDEMKELDIPQKLILRNAKLKKYCEYRLKSYEYMYKAIDENTEKYQDMISMYDKKIGTILAEF